MSTVVTETPAATEEVVKVASSSGSAPAACSKRLSPAHVEYLSQRAVPVALAERASLRTVDGERAARLVGFARSLPCTALAIPYPDVTPAYVRLRLDEPECLGGARYLAPKDRPVPLYVPPGDDAQPLLVVESPIKALALMAAGYTAVGLGGTGTTLTKGDHEHSWKAVRLAGREVVIVFDANRLTNPNVARDEARLAVALEHSGALVKVTSLPAGPGHAGWGPDDFLAELGAPALADVIAASRSADPLVQVKGVLELGGHEAVTALLEDLPFLAAIRERGAATHARISEVLRRAKVSTRLLDGALRELRERLRTSDKEISKSPSFDENYAVHAGCMCATRIGPLGTQTTVLCSFDARIVEESILDDGFEEKRRFVLEGTAPDGARFPQVTLSADELQSTRWALERWGHRAVMHPAPWAPGKVCTAILRLSQPETVRVYRHTGWRQIEGQWVFLHAGGAVGSASARVELDGPLARYVLPDRTDDAVAAVRASLRFLDVAPPGVTLPLFGVLYRAPTVSMFPADLVPWLYGPTGAMKSTLVAVLLSHFGSFSRLQMPASWADTPATLEYKLSLAKDLLLPIDDFVPRSSDPSDEMRRKSATVLRSAGNQSARGRMNRDLTARPDRPPRALAIVTGEDLPDGESVTARMLPLRLATGMVNVKALSAVEKDLLRLPHAMRAYLEWLAVRHDEMAGYLPELFVACRDMFRADGAHPRIPEAAAHTFMGHCLFLRFARDLGAVTDAEAGSLFDQARQALLAIGRQQAQLGSHVNPARRFLEVLASLAAQRHVGFAERPEDDLASSAGCEQIGWRDRDRKLLYLLPDAAFRVVVEAMKSAGESMPLRPRTLWERLGQLGVLRDQEAGHHTAKRVVGKMRQRVLVLAEGVLEDGPEGGTGEGGAGEATPALGSGSRPAPGGDGAEPVEAEAAATGPDPDYRVVDQEDVITATASEVSCAPPPFLLVEHHEALAALAEAVARSERVALDTETTGLDPLRERLRLVQLAVPDGRVFLVDLFALGSDLGPLAAALSGATLVGHNLQFDLAFLRRHLDLAPAHARCTEIASRLLAAGLHPHVKGYQSLRGVLGRELGVIIDKTEQLSDWSGALRPEQLAYAARDVSHLLRLDEALSGKLRADGLERVFDLECALLSGVVALELDGVGIDRAAWEAYVAASSAEAAGLRARLCSELDIENPNAALQVARALRRLGIKADKTNKEALAAFGHVPIVQALLRYRTLNTFARGAGRGVLEALDAHGDGRVHASFDSLSAPTGRFGCSEPNLLGLPRAASVRRCVVPPPGCTLIAADYAAIELRVIARIAKDAHLQEIFASRGDPHRATASAALGKPESEITSEERQSAKAVNFGFAFGMGAERFISYARGNYGVEVTRAEAERFRASYLRLYDGVARWQAATRASMPLEVRTASGRVQRFRDAVGGYCQRLNTPVQGTAADGLKQAMVLLRPRLAAIGARIVLCVHDELVVEAPADRAEEAKQVVERGMVEGMQTFVEDVPIVVEAAVRSTWAKE